MEYRDIQIVDTGADKYSQRQSDRCLGRRYDNDAVSVRITKPQAEQDSKCFMIVTNEYGQVLDHIDVTGGEAPIRQHISRYGSVNIGFSFSRLDGYVKNCSFEKYTFAPALDPNSTIEIEPEQKENFDILISSSFVDVKWKEGTDDTIQYLNSKGEVVKEIQIKTGIDNTIDNLVNYYLKSETYNREEVNNLIKTINSFKKEIVDTLPIENIDENTIYLVPKQDGSGNDYYDEYLYINDAFEFIGSTQIDLTDYVKKTDYAIKNVSPGIVDVQSNCGLDMRGGQVLTVVPASEAGIDSKGGLYTGGFGVIAPNNLDYAVKVGLTTNTKTLTEEEKASVQNWLGITSLVGDINTALESILGV